MFTATEMSGYSSATCKVQKNGDSKQPGGNTSESKSSGGVPATSTTTDPIVNIIN